jgi:ribosome maturation factor RimP
MLNNKSKTEKEIIRLAEPVLTEMGYELIDLSYKKEPGWVLRLFIDKENGITLENCESVSRLIGDMLDANNLIGERYNFEVSSPGINRPLTKKEDFTRFAGNKIILQLKQPYADRKNFKGILKGITDNNVEIAESDSSTYNIPFDLISKARMDII